MTKIKKKKYFPSSFLVIIAIMILFIIASWIGKALSDEITGVGLLDVFTSIWKGFLDKGEVILFIFSIGGTLGVMTKIKAIDAGIGVLVKKLDKKIWLLIPVLMLLFGLGGTTYGMWEETIAFIPVLVPVFKKSGYGSFTAILVILIGAGTGCLASTVNPFSVGAAVGSVATVPKDAPPGTTAVFAGLTTGTAQGIRWLSFVLFEIVAITMVMIVATKFKKANAGNFKTNAEAKASVKNGGIMQKIMGPVLVEGLDQNALSSNVEKTEDIPFTIKRKISLGLFILTFVLMILLYLPWGDIISGSTLESSKTSYNNSMWWFASTKSSGFADIGDWYFVSVAALFLFATTIIFAINLREFKSETENAEEGFINSYMLGVKDVVSVCLLIATAGGLGRILSATGYGDLIANHAAKGLTSWIGFGVVIFIVSIVLSILVPSTSGFAGAFMPIFAAVAVKAFPGREATAISIAMLGFIFANGLANFFTPTSAALMGYTQYAGVPYNVWIKHTWKITFVAFLLSLVIIVVCSGIAANGSNLF